MEITESQREAFLKLVDFAATVDRINRWSQAGLLTDAELRHDLSAACAEHGHALLDAIGAYARPA